MRQKQLFKNRTKKFVDFLENQNETVYKDLGLEVCYEKEGLWLEFGFIEEDLMFEEEIAKRRNLIIEERDQNDGDKKELEEMAKLLNEFAHVCAHE